MKLKSYNTIFFFLILTIVTVLTFFLFKPFLTAILTAAVFAGLFQRPYQYFKRILKGREHLSSLFTVTLAFLIIVIPVIATSGLIINEISNTVDRIEQNGGVYSYLADISEGISSLPFLSNFDLQASLEKTDVTEVVKSASEWSLTIIQKTYQGIVSFVLWIFVLFFTMYYFLIEGHKVNERIMYLSPLKEDQEEMLIKRFISISKATLKGTLILGLIQGTLGGLLFWLVGIPSAIIWGVIMVFLSVIPMAGSGFIWFPAGLILIATGNVFGGVLVLAFGFAVISSIDNILRPKLVGRDTQMHPLFVFFSTLGGLALFGLPGFIIGPIVMALFLSLWEIYGVEFRAQLEE